MVFCLACGFWASLWFLGELVVFGRACGFWNARSALRVRNGKSRQKQCSEALIQVRCVSRARSALRVRNRKSRQKPRARASKQSSMRVTCAKRTACEIARVAPTTRPKNRQMHMMWFFAVFVVFGRACGFCRLCGFWASLWFFAVFVVFCLACGFLPSLWFLGELVVFCRLCGFWASLWFFAVFVVFCLACGFWASLWFLGELVVFGRVSFPISPASTRIP